MHQHLRSFTVVGTGNLEDSRISYDSLFVGNKY